MNYVICCWPQSLLGLRATPMRRRPQVKRLLFSPHEAAQALGVSPSRLYEMQAEGMLSIHKLGGRSVVLADEIDRIAKVVEKSAPPKLLYNINEAAYVLGISRAKLYKLINDGILRKQTMFGRSVFLADEVAEYVYKAFGY